MSNVSSATRARSRSQVNANVRAGRPRGGRPRGRSRLIRTCLLALLGASGLLLAGSVAAFAYFSRDLPSPQNITERHQFQSTKIYDRHGALLHELYDADKGKRTALPLNQIPQPVVNAFLAAEDARFYENPGIDVQAIVRATLGNLANRDRLAGGSTITQQLVKNTLLTDERTFSRKIREAILAISVSRRYSKDQILEMYLNSVYLGHQAYGIQAAAETYFGKPVQQLILPEAAVLAGLPRSPSTTNPWRDEQAAKEEQQRVLSVMVRHGFLSSAEAEGAAAQPLTYRKQQLTDLKAPHFVMWVREQLESNPLYGRQGLYERGLEVTTTLDLRLQELAERTVRDHVAGLSRFNAHDGALVAINPATGEILAMVGSADYANKAIQGEVNVALAQRQPGSSIKPITYLAAFQKGWSPATIVDDVETEFQGSPPYRPQNYDGQFHGKVTVRAALANSYNIPAVKALQFVGVPAMVDVAKKMGLTSLQEPQKYGLAVTLGGGEVRLLELTSAYGVLAQGGKRVPPASILKVSDTAGKVLDAYAGPRPQPVVDAARAYLITSILADNEARAPGFGANSPLKLSRPAAVKTGTTDDFKDNWTVGYTSQLVTGVWVGNADNAPMRGTTGLTGAAPIWHDFMEAALKPLPFDPLGPPPGLERGAVGRESGKLWTEGCPEPKLEELFVAGTLPKEKCEAPTPAPTPLPSATPTPLPSATPTAANTPTTPTTVAATRTPRPAETPAAADPTVAAGARTATTAAGTQRQPQQPTGPGASVPAAPSSAPQQPGPQSPGPAAGLTPAPSLTVTPANR